MERRWDRGRQPLGAMRAGSSHLGHGCAHGSTTRPGAVGAAPSDLARSEHGSDMCWGLTRAVRLQNLSSIRPHVAMLRASACSRPLAGSTAWFPPPPSSPTAPPPPAHLPLPPSGLANSSSPPSPPSSCPILHAPPTHRPSCTHPIGWPNLASRKHGSHMCLTPMVPTTYSSFSPNGPQTCPGRHRLCATLHAAPGVRYRHAAATERWRARLPLVLVRRWERRSGRAAWQRAIGGRCGWAHSHRCRGRTRINTVYIAFCTSPPESGCLP